MCCNLVRFVKELSRIIPYGELVVLKIANEVGCSRVPILRCYRL